ncbi:uncharacterized protein MONBRDRAFT_10840 [Monosiga brevicollis MX1]|uniref:GDP-fucose protein O-fucosyltransferase 2 n=1 Tax=Monosiga brevicollis TaxID=81824 RepID=A9V7E2_MONBE|nr:uncharacterized protein MONBRDRAFT_10840 [Monosiga brevicollis MX1]EDQ86569.1 predicted protein [Monosiga brevicollis MX1]|eukprot:XP_001748682.1 hypothetical protein [Monosiga brevicollis MX1]
MRVQRRGRHWGWGLLVVALLGTWGWASDGLELHALCAVNGAGFGNQHREYVGCAAVAEQLQRSLTLGPFLINQFHEQRVIHTHENARRYLELEQVYDVDRLRGHVQLHTAAAFRAACPLDEIIVLDLTPESKRKASDRNTQCLALQSVGYDCPTHLRHVNRPDRVYLAGLPDVLAAEGLATHRCLLLLGSFKFTNQLVSRFVRSRAPAEAQLVQETFSWFYRVDRLQQMAVRYMSMELRGEPFLALHLRFEEEKCRYGHNNLGLPMRAKPPRETGTAICFRFWNPNEPPTAWLPLAKVMEFVAARARDQGARRLFLASDNQAHSFWTAMSREARMHNLTLAPPLWEAAAYLEHRQFEDNIELMLVEQELCRRAAHFVGTISSTWSAQVAVERRMQRQADSSWLGGIGNLPSPEPVGVAYFP